MGELIGIEKAAALHGIAINRAYSQADRLAAAVQALDIYKFEYDALAAKVQDHRPHLYDPVPPVDITGEKADELDKVLEDHVQAYDEEMNRSPFPEDAWDDIFSTVPDYPTNLPDDVVWNIADLALRVREMADDLGSALESGDRLRILMGPSLISGSMKRINEFIESEFERGGF